MPVLSKEIQQYHSLQAEIAKLQTKADKLAQTIVKNECPYKIGDCIEYMEWWDNNKTKYGIINKISFAGVDFEAIDNKWKFSVVPTDKNFKEFNRRRYRVNLGSNKEDKIKVIK